MSILLTLKNINLSFGQKAIFKDSELTIHEGDRIGLIGLNGQGKSTLFKIINKEVTPDISTPPFTYDKSNNPFKIFSIPQELNIEDYKDLNIEDFYLSFYPELYAAHVTLQEDPANEKCYEVFQQLNGWDIQNAYLNYLKGFDLLDLTKKVTELSGGEKRKIALAIGLSSTAEILLWDEPTNHLDIETIERFEDELMHSRKTYLIISHDRYLLNHTTDKIFHIERGKISTFKGKYLEYLEYLESKEAELRKNLDKLQNHHRRELAWMRQGIKARRTRSKKRVEGFENIKSNISEIKSRSRKVVNLGLLHSGRKSKRLVEIEEGQFSYGEHEILKDLNLVIAKNDKIALIGPNGAGKSTLIKIFKEELKLSSGHQKNAQNLKVITFDQNRESLDLEKTPIEVIGEGNDFVILGDGTRKHIVGYLESFLFTSDQAHRPISTLSGGEKNRLQLAIFMKESADLWVFDEPTNDLDIETIELLEKELKAYQSALIIISHDRAFIDNICDTTWLINEKKVEIFEGGYTQVAPYLHALELEKKLNLEAKKSAKSEAKQEQKQATKMTFKEKERFSKIESLIESIEKEIETMTNDLGKFDFTDMSAEKKQEYKELNDLKENKEKELESLYQEWEDLNSKI